MNLTSWLCAIVLLMVLAGCAGIQGCLADSSTNAGEQPAPGIPPEDMSPKPTVSPTLKTTIAPIHTKEPVIKPPVDQPSATPSLTEAPGIPQITPTTSLKPETTPTGQASNTSEGNESASTYFQRGLVYQEGGNFTAAIIEYDHAIAKEPYFTDAWYHKAVSFENLGLWDEAYQAYRFLLTIDPGYPAELNFSGINQSGPENTMSPPIRPPPDQVPFLWIAGAGITGAVIAGLLLSHRRRRVSSLRGDNDTAPVRSSQPGQNPFPDIDKIVDEVRPYYSGDEDVFRSVIRISIEIAREGREGKPIGTAFILGDSDAVLERSRQLILNPVAGHSEEERLITNPDMRENVKELSLVDGAFVIRDNGIVEAAGRIISIDTSNVRLPKGFGTRHVSVAAITQETDAIGIVVSESGGLVRVFAKGIVIVETS